MSSARPLVLSCPLPRSLELIFQPGQEAKLRAAYEIVETSDEALARLPDSMLGKAKYIIGQPPLSSATLSRLKSLRCIFNVESNLIQNMPYDEAFARGIHVVTTGQVFAEPVAELGLGSRSRWRAALWMRMWRSGLEVSFGAATAMLRRGS